MVDPFVFPRVELEWAASVSTHYDCQEDTMNRREFIATTGAGAAVALFAQTAMAAEQGGHNHGAAPNTPQPGRPRGGPHPRQALLQATSHCLTVGQICLQHTMMMLSTGDIAMAACAKSVSDMGAVCAALQHLAAADSPHLPALAKVAAEVCDTCEKECRKHEAMHFICKECAEACKACAVECRKVTS